MSVNPLFYQITLSCGATSIDKSSVPIFLLRHLFGGDYKPPDTYSGVFVDLPRKFANNDRSLWAEALHRLGVDLTSDRCAPPDATQPYFCPLDTVTRAELLWYLAQVQMWELKSVEGDHFLDVHTDTPAHRAVEYAARHGFLAEADPHCPALPTGPRFCPDDPARRAFAAVVMVRAFGQTHE